MRSERAVPQKVIQAENSPPTSLFTSVIWPGNWKNGFQKKFTYVTPQKTCIYA